MTAFTNHFLFEFKTGLRNSGAMMMYYLLPLGFYAAMGFVMVAINPGNKELLIPSMIVFAAMSGNILGLPNGHVEARDAGIYRSFKINGVPAISILSTPSLSTSVHLLIIARTSLFPRAAIGGRVFPFESSSIGGCRPWQVSARHSTPHHQRWPLRQFPESRRNALGRS